MRDVRVTELLVATAVVAGCHGARPAKPADPWQRLAVPGANAVYEYPDPIVRYAPDDRGAYVVHVAVTDDDARRALLDELHASDDIVGDDGYVVRLSASAHDAWTAREGVAGVTILQPSDRRSAVVLDRSSELPEARIDLFADATAGETAAIAAWVTWRGGRVLWQGKTALRVRLPLESISEASRLGPVRWIE